MSDLYKEAIADAKKLRELAEEEARKSVIESVSPYIKKMIAKETANATSFFFEEEDDASLQPPSQPLVAPETASPDKDPVLAASAGDAGVDSALDAPVTADEPAMAPLSAAGSEVANVPLPDADGKITIDFDQLFTDSGIGDTVSPVDTAEMPLSAPDLITASSSHNEPAPIEPVATDPGSSSLDAASPSNEVSPESEVGELAAPEAPSMETGELPAPEEEENPELPLTEARFNEKLVDVAFRIDQVFVGGFEGKRYSNLAQERLKNNLISLLESLDNLQSTGVISEGKARHNEKRLEFLFLKLKEGILTNSYTTEKVEKEDPMGKSLKEYAAKLFESDEQENLEQDSVNSGDTGLPVRKDASEHAKKVSGVSPEVEDLFKEELEGGSKTVSVAAKSGTTNASPVPGTGKSKKMPLEQGEPIAEEVEVKGHAGFGDSSEKPVASPDMFFEIDEKELMEAVAAIRKEKAASSKPASKGPWEKGKPEAKSASSVSVLKKESKMNEQAMDEMGGMDEDLVLNVSLPDEIEDELSTDDLDVDLMLSPDEDSVDFEDDLGDEGDVDDLDGDTEGDLESGDEEMVFVGDDEEDLGVDGDLDATSSDEDEVLLTDDEDDLDEVSDPMTGPASDLAPKPIKESKNLRALRHREVRARKLLEAHRAETKQLKTEMAETNLFLSKLLYLNKFLQKEGLSRKVKQQIVEHLDRASTLAEAKEIYLKIKRKLDESVEVRPSATVIGSASKPTTAGSAKLNESANAVRNSDEAVLGTVERWQKLAKISKVEN